MISFSSSPGGETDKFIIPKNNGLKITGTFLDEISHDIPHQNWSEREWEQDFRHMKSIGIDTVIMIRSGYRKFITPGSIGIRVIYLGRLKIINTLLMKSGNNTVKNTKVLADGISVARLAVRLKGLLMLSGQWENNARMSLEVFLLLFLLGLTEKRL